MLVALAVVLAVVVVVLVLRLRAVGQRQSALVAERSALRNELATVEGLVRAAPDWIWVADHDGAITFSNPAGLTLLGREDLVGRTLAALTPPDARGAREGVVRRLHADGSARTVDSRSVRAG